MTLALRFGRLTWVWEGDPLSYWASRHCPFTRMIAQSRGGSQPRRQIGSRARPGEEPRQHHTGQATCKKEGVETANVGGGEGRSCPGWETEPRAQHLSSRWAGRRKNKVLADEKSQFQGELAGLLRGVSVGVCINE